MNKNIKEIYLKSQKQDQNHKIKCDLYINSGDKNCMIYMAQKENFYTEL